MNSARFVQHKINIQKSIVLLYTAMNNLKSEIKKTTEFTITSQKIKYLGINVSKEMQDCTLKTTKHC